MDFVSAVKKCLLTDCFKISGRAPRSEYWWFYLFAFIASIVLALFNVIPILGQIISLVAGIWILIAQLTVLARRLHDTNRSALWILAPLGCSIAGLALLFVGIYFESSAFSVVSTILFLATFVAYIAIFVFTLLPGTQGDNKYGPDPLG